MVELAASVWRDYVTDGVPSSGGNKPKKSEIRALLAYYESLVTLSFTSGKVYATKAALDADLVPGANTPALVIGDAIVGNDGLYMKVGATTTGSWTQLLDFVPGAQIVHAVDVGDGTPNDIIATTTLALSSSGSQLIRLDVFEANTGSPVTVAFNGGTPLAVKTASGNDVVAGGLTAGPVLGFISGSTFRLLSDQASAAVLAAAEAAVFAAELAADEAEAARDITVGYASDAVSQGNVPIYSTVLGLTALTIPAGITAYRTLGYAAIGDNGAWTNVIEVTNSGTLQPYQRQTNGGTRRWQLNENNPCIEMFGGAADCVTSGGGQENPTSIVSGTDNLQPFYDMIAYQRARYTSTVMSFPIAPVRFNSPGSYRFTAHVNVKLTVKIMGLANSGQAGPMSQRCVFPQGESGFLFHRSATIDYGKEVVPFGGATGSVWDGSAPAVVCCGTPVLDTTSYGLQMRGRCEFYNPRVYNFSQGIRIYATSGGTDATEGNANYWRVWGGRLARNVEGFHVNGADVNGGFAIGVECNGNLLRGVYDDSFLGCDWYSIGTDGNGSATYLTQVHNLGGTFMCLNPALASTTEPTVATSAPAVRYDALPVWYYKGTGSPGATAPQWVSGTQTFYQGGSVLLMNDSSASKRHGGYDEPNQSYGYVNTRCRQDGGATLHMGPGVLGGGMGIIGSKLFRTESSGTLIEVEQSHNRATGNNRQDRKAWKIGYLTDNVTEKIMAVIDAGTDGNGNPVFKIGTNTGADANTIETQLQITGGSGSGVKRVSVFPGALATPATNGEVSFQLTSNTSLTFKVKGSDGVVRSVSLALA